MHRLYVIIRGEKSECNATIKQRKNPETSARENPLYAETSRKGEYSIEGIFLRHIKETSSQLGSPLTPEPDSPTLNQIPEITIRGEIPNNNRVTESEIKENLSVFVYVIISPNC